MDGGRMEVKGVMDSFVFKTQSVKTIAAREAFALLKKCSAMHSGIRKKTGANACFAISTLNAQTIHVSVADAVSQANGTLVIHGTRFLEM